MGRLWHRLKRRSDFLDIAGHGLRRNTPAFVVQAKVRAASDSDHISAVRVGFTASRKVGNAVARNRAKRRLRALCDRIFPITPTTAAPAAWDFVLIARTEAISRDFAAMEHDLRHAMQRLVAGDGKPSRPPQDRTRR